MEGGGESKLVSRGLNEEIIKTSKGSSMVCLVDYSLLGPLEAACARGV